MQYTLIQPGPSRYVLSPVTDQIQVTLTEEVVRVTLTEAVVQIGGGEPAIDTDFLIAYQIAKL